MLRGVFFGLVVALGAYRAEAQLAPDLVRPIALDPALVAQAEKVKGGGKPIDKYCTAKIVKDCFREVNWGDSWNFEAGNKTKAYYAYAQPRRINWAKDREYVPTYYTKDGKPLDGPGQQPIHFIDLYLLEHRFNDALDRLNAVIKANPRSVDALVRRAELLESAGRYDLAGADFAAAQALTQKFIGDNGRGSSDGLNYLQIRAANYLVNGSQTAQAETLLAATKPVHEETARLLEFAYRDLRAAQARWTPQVRAGVDAALAKPYPCGIDTAEVILADQANYRPEALFWGRVQRDGNCGRVDRAAATLESRLPAMLASQNAIRDHIFWHDDKKANLEPLLDFYRRGAPTDNAVALFRKAKADFSLTRSGNIYYKALIMGLVDVLAAGGRYVEAGDELWELRVMGPAGWGLTYDPNGPAEQWMPGGKLVEMAKLAQLSGKQLSREPQKFAYEFENGIYQAFAKEDAARANASFEATQKRMHEEQGRIYDAYANMAYNQQQLENCDRYYGQVTGALSSVNLPANADALNTMKGDCAALRARTGLTSHRFSWEN